MAAPYRRRRILWTLALLTCAGFYYLTQHAPHLLSLPSSLKDMGLGFSPDSSPPGRVAQAKAKAQAAAAAGDAQAQAPMYAGEGAHANVREIDALLYFLTAHPERKLDEDGGSIRVEGLGSVAVDPAQPIDLRVYAPDGGEPDWAKIAKDVRERYPLVVFSKTTCPFSKRAKELLATYKIEPAPKIIEINMRSDGPILQSILARLTGRRTVPNILVQGDSIGGSDDIHLMHDEHKLKKRLENGGVIVKGDVDTAS